MGWRRAEDGGRRRSSGGPVHHGQVAYTDWRRGFGLLLIIAHDDDYMTLYGHNQTLLKERGEWVAAGEAIALTTEKRPLAVEGYAFGEALNVLKGLSILGRRAQD